MDLVRQYLDVHVMADLQSIVMEYHQFAGVIETTLKTSAGVIFLRYVNPNYLAVGLINGDIEIWDLNIGTVKMTLEGHGSMNSGIVTILPGIYSNNDIYIASTSIDGTLGIWNLTTAKNELLRTERNGLTSLVFISGLLAVGTVQGQIRLWDLLKRKWTMFRERHKSWVTSLVVLPDGRLASSSTDQTIKIWNIETGELQITLQGDWSHINTMVMYNNHLASGDENGNIRLWNLTTWQAENILPSNGVRINVLTVFPHHPFDYLVVGYDNGTIQLWTPHGDVVLTLNNGGSVRTLAILPGSRLASGSEDTVIIYE